MVGINVELVIPTSLMKALMGIVVLWQTTYVLLEEVVMVATQMYLH
jgi:hypothetical protein